MCSKKNADYSLRENFSPYLELIPNGPTKDYIEHRVIDQIDWYNKKSTKNQTNFKRGMISSIILSALIPVITLFSDSAYPLVVKVFITAISSGITAISAIISLCHVQELWVQYRSNCEILQSVLHRFFTKSGEFYDCASDERALDLLVMTCEEYLTQEFQTWVASNTPRPDNPSTNQDSSTSS